MTTIVTSRVGQIIDYLVATLTALPSLADPARVFDGPALTDFDWQDAVFVGFDGDWNGNFEAAPIDQIWAYLGNTTRVETVTVNCAAISWSGENTVKTSRDRVLAVLAAVETALRTDPTLGIDGSTVAEFTVGSLYQEQFRTGLGVRILFTVTVKTTLTTS